MNKAELNTILQAKQEIINNFQPDTLRLRHLIGEKVQTPDGIGILLGNVDIEFNGLYFTDRSHWQVWYGTGNGQTRWVSQKYDGKEITEIK